VGIGLWNALGVEICPWGGPWNTLGVVTGPLNTFGVAIIHGCGLLDVFEVVIGQGSAFGMGIGP